MASPPCVRSCDFMIQLNDIIQCLTLAPTVALKAEVASEEDKEWLSNALYHLAQDKTGSLDGDVLKLSKLIDEYVSITVTPHG